MNKTKRILKARKLEMQRRDVAFFRLPLPSLYFKTFLSMLDSTLSSSLPVTPSVMRAKGLYEKVTRKPKAERR